MVNRTDYEFDLPFEKIIRLPRSNFFTPSLCSWFFVSYSRLPLDILLDPVLHGQHGLISLMQVGGFRKNKKRVMQISAGPKKDRKKQENQ